MPHTNQGQALRLLFAGTPDFAARHLDALIQAGHQLVGVYTQPDRRAGRGKKLRPSPVKQLAERHKLPVFQPESLKDPSAQEQLAALQADLMVVVAYGQILPATVLEAPRLGCINVHASLLPRWRGAAPIQRAIAAGDGETGITIMQMDEGLDTGDMLLKVSCPIEPGDTAGQLHDRLGELGGPALCRALAGIAQGSLTPEPQTADQACYAPKISKAEANLDWTRPSDDLARQVRAFNPFPVAHTRRAQDSQPIRVWAAQSRAGASTTKRRAAPGEILTLGPEGVSVACGEGQLLLQQLQLAGKRPMSLDELLRGHPGLLQPGDYLTNDPETH